MCGTFVGEGSSSHSPSDVRNIGYHPQNPPNTFEYRETQSSRTLKASFTDAVGNSLNETLNNFFGNRLLTTGTRKPLTTERVTEPLKQLQSGELSFSEDSAHKNLANVEILSNNTFERIFRLEEQELIILEPRIKAKSKLEYSKKFTVLVIYYFTVIQRKPIDKTQLRSILKKAKLLNNHLQSWLAKTTDITISSNGLELSIPAQEQVSNILRDIFDTDIQGSWMPDGKSRPPSGKKGSDKTSAKEVIDVPADSTKKRTTPSGKLSPTQIINKLLEQGYFNEKRTISDILEHCSSHLAQTRKANELSSTLTRFIRDGKLKREKNKDQQFEYYV